MRFGLYNGINSGIGISANGGNTWKIAATTQGFHADAITAGTIDAQLVRISGDNYMYWDKAFIHIANPQNSQQIMRFGKYDGTNYGLGISTDGGVTWKTAANMQGIFADAIIIGSKMSGFTIDERGLTNGQNIQLMSHAVIKLGGIEMDGGNHPFLRFGYSGLTNALYIGEGSMEINQVLYANGPTYLGSVKTTSNPPNMWRDPATGEIYHSTWTPSFSGGTDPDPDPDPGEGQTNMIIVVDSSPKAATVGDTVVWSGVSYQHVEPVTNWRYEIINPSGNVVAQGNSSYISHVVDAVGEWSAKFTATDALGTASATGGGVTVTSSSGGGTPTTGKTNTDNVRIRSSPNAGSGTSSIVTVLAHKDTQVVIRGPLVPDSQGGSIPWWPVRYDSREPESYYGYIRSDLLDT